MRFAFSKNVAELAPSAIREILKATAQSDTIPFAAGNPAPEAFPVDSVRRIAARILAERPIDCLQYGVTEGFAPLREKIRRDCARRLGTVRDFDDCIVTSGAQQVMDLLCRVLCDPGDEIVTETPSFIGSLNSFRAHGCVLRGIPVQEDGMDLAVLEAILKKPNRVKFIYTIPNFQNPTGVTMSAEKRKTLYEIARKYRIPILEDNPYGDLIYDGDALPCVKSFDEEGLVIYAGSFSKILSPGLRVGYTLAPRTVLAKMTVAKQGSDVHTSMLSQILVDAWLHEVDLPAHVSAISRIYRAKRDLLCDGILDTPLTFQTPKGGLFLWCRLPEEIPMMEFVRNAAEKKLAMVPGSAFSVDPQEPCNAVRLNFSTPTDAQIQKGVQIIKDLFVVV